MYEDEMTTPLWGENSAISKSQNINAQTYNNSNPIYAGCPRSIPVEQIQGVRRQYTGPFQNQPPREPLERSVTGNISTRPYQWYIWPNNNDPWHKVGKPLFRRPAVPPEYLQQQQQQQQQQYTPNNNIANLNNINNYGNNFNNINNNNLIQQNHTGPRANINNAAFNATIPTDFVDNTPQPPVFDYDALTVPKPQEHFTYPVGKIEPELHKPIVIEPIKAQQEDSEGDDDDDEDKYDVEVIEHDDPLEALKTKIRSAPFVGSIKVTKCRLKSVPEMILGMKSLTKLCIQENDIPTLNELVLALPGLEALDCSDNPITTLEPVRSLNKLKSLSGYKMKLTKIPLELCGCTTLEKLNLFNNQITSVPPELSKLRNLKELNIASNKLMQIPEGAFDGLSSLEQLSLFWNRLIKLPSFKHLTSLTELKLYDNNMPELPEFGVHPKLKEASFNKNQLSELPAYMFSPMNLPALTVLEASNNRLTSIPSTLSTLPSLSKLVLANNLLTELPPSIFSMTTITFLDIASNNFTQLPEAIGGLTRMVTLFVQSNKITGLPQAMKHLNKLTRVNLKGNPLKLVDTTTKDIFETVREFTVTNGGKFVY